MLKLSKHIVLNTALLTFVLISISLFSTAQNTEETALQLFENEKYEEALPLYKELYALYPNDQQFQYCYGVCLTETNNFGNEARKLLLQSSLGDVPSKVFFYIGKNYHALNDFKTANNYYSRFDEYAKNKAKKGVGLKSIWEDCINNINPFVTDKGDSIATKDTSSIIELNSAPVVNTKTILDSLDTNNEETETIDDKTVLIEQSDSTINKQTTVSAENKYDNNIAIVEKEPLIKNNQPSTTPEVPDTLMNSTIDFIITPEIYYLKINQFKTAEGKTNFIEGWKNAESLKSALNTIDSLRNVYESTNSSSKKASIAQKVVDLELATINLKAKSDNSFNAARSFESNFWNTASDEAATLLMEENDSIKSINEEKIEQIIVEEPEIPVIDTIVAATDSVLIENEPTIEIKNKIIYKIQIGAYSKGLPEYIDKLYKKLAVLRRIDNYTDNRGIVVYTVGEVDNFEDAVKLQNQIRQEGVKDAFVVAYNNGKRITLKEAKEIIGNE